MGLFLPYLPSVSPNSQLLLFDKQCGPCWSWGLGILILKVLLAGVTLSAGIISSVVYEVCPGG